MRKVIVLLRVLAGLIGVVGLYIIFSIVISEYVFPQGPLPLSGYFQPGDRLASRFEGFDQTVLAVDEDWMHTRLEVKPHAEGPPEHFHEAFTENFTVKSGTLSVMINGEKKIVRAGETVSVPPLTRHRPFNETDETVVVESSDPRSVPTKFGYVLSQLYGMMDQFPNGPSTRHIVLQLSVYGNDADTWIADGPSLNVQKAMRVMIAPTARLMGYTNFYEKYRPRH